MTRDQRKEVFETIGQIAIVVSLVFVALEVREANLATRIAARDSASQGHIDYMSKIIVPEVLATADRKAVRNEEMSDLELAQLTQFHAMRWRHYERVFFLYQYEVISEAEWRGYENGILRAFTNPSGFWDASRNVWARDKSLLSEQFSTHVDALVATSQ